MDYGWFITLNGWIYVVICVITIPLHILVSISIFKTGTVRKRITLRILLSLALADSIQLIFQGTAGFSIVLGVEIDYLFNNIMGVIMNALWAVTLIQHVLLALNRLKVVTARRLIQEEEFRYCDSVIVISWIWGAAFTCCYNIDGYHNLYFDPWELDWKLREPGFTLPIRILFWFRLTALIVGVIATLVVIFSLIITRRTLSMNSRLVTSRDLKLFIQTTIVFLLAITHVAGWNLIPSPDTYTLAFLNLEWVLVCALLPYLNLAMSSDIRTSLLRILQLSSRRVTSQSKAQITVFNATKNKPVSTSGGGIDANK